MSPDTGSIALPAQMHHIGVVVKNLAEVAKFLSSMWGLTPWDIFEYTSAKDRIIVGEQFSIKIAFAKSGATQLEHGCPMLASAYNDDGTRCCYFETKPGGIIIELEEP